MQFGVFDIAICQFLWGWQIVTIGILRICILQSVMYITIYIIRAEKKIEGFNDIATQGGPNVSNLSAFRFKQINKDDYVLRLKRT